MKRSSLWSFLGLLVLQLVLANGYEFQAESGTSPTSKVIELLEEMEEKGNEDIQKEKLAYTEYQAWCVSTQADKERSLKDSKSKLDILKADVEKLAVDITALETDLPKLTADIEKWKEEKAKATKEREEERDDYTKTFADYTKAISSMGKARDTIKEQDTEKKTAKEAFLQLSSATAPLDARASIEAFIAESSVVTEAAEEDPTKEEGYKFQSGMIIDLMDKLLDKFKGERHTLEKEEIEKKGLYERLMQEKGASIETAEKSFDDKTAEKTKKVQTKAEKTAEIGQVEKLQEDDAKFLKELKENCETKGETFEKRQKTRKEEIAAIEEATKILKEKLKPAAEKKSLIQLKLKSKAGVSLASLRSDSRGIIKERAVSLLRERAEELHSHMLSALALRAADDPLAKVRKMISDMITRMQEESTADAEKEGWCKKELATNEQTRTSKQQAVESLRGEISKLETDIEELGEDIADLAKATAKLAADMGEATKLRTKEKKDNEETITNAKAAQAAVAEAVVALKAFYGKVEQDKAFLQEGSEEDQKPPKTFEGDYTGMESGGVTAMLEVIESDFAKEQSEAEEDEEESQTKYDKFMADAKADEAAKKKESELKSSSKTKKSGSKTEKEVDLRTTTKALDSAKKYYEDLQPQCINIGPTREEKIAARKQEIASLKQVLEILEGA